MAAITHTLGRRLLALFLGTALCAEGATRIGSDELALRIDAELAALWERQGIEPAPPADDAEFLRRVHLDLVGKLPSVGVVRDFLVAAEATTTTDADRRRVVEDLLGRGAFAAHWSHIWKEMLLEGAENNFAVRAATPAMEDWLRLRFAAGVAYDRLVRQLVSLSLDETQPQGLGRARQGGAPSPRAFFEANERQPEQLAASTSRIFLGVQVQCAQCHDHPFTDWTQHDFWSYAAFFSAPSSATQQVDPAGLVREAAAATIRIPQSEQVVQAAFLGGGNPDWQSGVAPRTTLAAWMTGAENPYFAPAAVNRIWHQFFGRGLVHPVDDLDPSNPPLAPELFALLVEQFVANDYEVRYLVRAITATRAYQLSSRVGSSSAATEADLQRAANHFARMPLRRMTAIQLWQSWQQATGWQEETPTAEPSVLSGGTTRERFLRTFADRSVPPTESSTSILQALALMNGELTRQATDLETSHTLQSVVEAPFWDTRGSVETLFLATLSRYPDAEETAALVTYIDRQPANRQGAALADLFWALLNSAEFVVVH